MANLQPTECAKIVVKEDEEDRLSHLPSDVLNHILSLALPTMTDAARTSVLSRFWRRRWLLAADELDFDVYKCFEDRLAGMSPLDEEMVKYIEWVTNVLHFHNGANEIDNGDKALLLKKLRFYMPMTEAFQEDVDKWISYAFSRRVESLEIKFMLHRYYFSPACRPKESRCCFRVDKLVESTLDCLKSLSLSGVIVTGDDIKSFLCKFRFLEHLKVAQCPALENVEVCGSALALKQLEIYGAIPTLSVIVRDTCLVSLTIYWINKLVLVNNPKLVVVEAIHYDPWDERILNQLSDCFSTLEVLTLNTTYFDDTEVFDGIPQLSELKQLTLIGDPFWNVTLAGLAALLSLSPKLEKLTLEFEKITNWYGKTANYETQGPRFLLQHLETVEVCGYCGAEAEDEILMFLFQHTVAPIKRVFFEPSAAFFDKFEGGDMSDGGLIEFVAKKSMVLRKLMPSVELFLNRQPIPC